MVTSMDPDAPRRERLALHDLDAQVNLIVFEVSVFQPFSSRGTFKAKMIIWWNLNVQNSIFYIVFREPCK